MNAAASTENPWDSTAYMRVVSARYDDGELVVDFADGTRSRVAVARMTRVEARRPNWSALGIGEYDVTVPTAEGDFEISSFAIRSLSDPAFRAHLDAVEAESARWTGQRIRELRRGRGLSIDALAAAARVAPSLVSSIERGTHDGNLVELERVVAAMGYDMRELFRPEAGSEGAAVRTA